jgi:hypothetical protein
MTVMEKLDLLPVGEKIAVGFEMFAPLRGKLARMMSDEKFAIAMFRSFEEKLDTRLVELKLMPYEELCSLKARSGDGKLPKLRRSF